MADDRHEWKKRIHTVRTPLNNDDFNKLLFTATINNGRTSTTRSGASISVFIIIKYFMEANLNFLSLKVFVTK